MAAWKIPLYKIYWDEEDVNAVEEVIRRGMHWTGGPSVGAFEKDIAGFIGMRHGTAFNSGTSGLSALVQLLGIGKGDQVIVPSFTFIATCNSVLHAGATPVFAEIEHTTFGLDPVSVEQKITEATRAIIPVHYAGAPCRIDELKKVADESGILLIEDAAEALGSELNGSPVGSVGKAAMFSFCGNKVMTTGEGGMIVTDDSELDEKMKLFRSHGRVNQGNYFDSSRSFDYLMAGHNLRMSELTAAVGRSQFAKLSTLISKRQELARLYNELLRDLPIKAPVSLPKSKHIYQMYTVLFEKHSVRERVRTHLTKTGIMTKIYFDCVHKTSFYSKFLEPNQRNLPVTEDLSSRVLTLPMYPGLSSDDVECVCRETRKAIRDR